MFWVGVFHTGFLKLGSFHGVPIRLHWTILLTALLFSRFRFMPGFWLGLVILLLVHELGHALLVRRRRLRVVDIQVHGLGGHCTHTRGSHYDSTIIAWGGVLAQFLVLGLPALLISAFVDIRSVFVVELLYAFTETNLIIAGLNLIPFPGLDGHLAWQFPRLWWKRRKSRKRYRKPAPGRGKGSRKPSAHQNDLENEDVVAMARRIAQQALQGDDGPGTGA